MELQYIQGLPGTGKTNYCINEIIKKSALNRDINYILIVPEQFSIQTERQLLCAAAANTMLNIKALSFQRLAYYVFEELGAPSLPLLEESGKIMLIRNIIYRRRKELVYFTGKSCIKQGFTEKIASAVSEFFQYRVTDDKLLNVINNISDENFKLKLTDLNLIYSDYIDFIHSGFASADQNLDILAKLAGDSYFIKNSEIYIDGFFSFTPQELNVIYRFIQTAKKVNITAALSRAGLTYKNINAYDMFYDPYMTVNKITYAAAELRAHINQPIFLSENHRHSHSPDLKRLTASFFRFPPPQYNELSENIKIRACMNKYSEINHLAAEIIRAVRENDWHFSDIAVILASEEYFKPLAAAFEKYDIPYFTDIKKSVKDFALVQLITSLFEIIIYNFNYEAVFKYLKTGFLTNSGQYNLSFEDIYLLENYVIEHGIRGKKRWSANKWTAGFGEGSQYNAEAVNNAKSAVYDSVLRMKSGSGKYTVREISESLIDFLYFINAPQTLLAMGTDSSNAGVNEQIQLWNITVDLIDKITEIFENSKMTVEEYYEILSAGFAGSSLKLIPPTQDQVITGEAERTRLHNIKALFILGANDGLLPKYKRDDGIISDKERQLAAENSMELAPDNKMLLNREEFRLYHFVTKPDTLLYISYSAGNYKGDEMKPALLISKIREMFVNVDFWEEKTEKEISLNDFLSPEPAFEKLISAVRASQDAVYPDIYKDAYKWFLTDGKYNERLKLIRRGLNVLEPQEYLDKKAVDKIYSDSALYTSISRLESFNQCPFSYFMKYNLKAFERSLYEAGPIDIGNIYHNILEMFSRRLQSSSGLSIKEINMIIESSVEKSFSGYSRDIFRSGGKYIYISKKIESIMKFAAYSIYDNIKNSGFELYGYEYRLGEQRKNSAGEEVEEIEKRLEPVKMSDGEASVMLTGRIDRIDIYRAPEMDFVKIVDYKSGGKQLSLKDIYMGVQLQLLMYMNAFIDMKSNTAEFNRGLNPAGIFYFGISEPEIKPADNTCSNEKILSIIDSTLTETGIVLDSDDIIKAVDKTANGKHKGFGLVNGDDFEVLRRYAESSAMETAKEILKGCIAVRPYTGTSGSSCDYCSYRAVCGIDLLDVKGRAFLQSENSDNIIALMLEKLEENKNSGD